MQRPVLSVALVLTLASGTTAQERSRPATAADLDAALKELPAEAAQAVYAQKKEVEKGRDPVRVSDYVAVGADGKPALHKNGHRTAEEFKSTKFLDCTTFATPLLHRVVHGAFAGFEQSKVNGYGDTVAAFYRLAVKHDLSAAELVAGAETAEWRRRHVGLYFFDLRKGSDGHIGFLVVTADGTRHVQMSMEKKGAGWRDEADFAGYVKAWAGKSSDVKVTLYAVHVDAAPKK